MRTVKAFATEELEVRKYGEKNDGIYQFGVVKSVWYGAIILFSQIFIYGGFVAILLLGAYLVSFQRALIYFAVRGGEDQCG